MIETEGQCLKMDSASEVYENALNNRYELGVLNSYEKLVERNVLFVEAELDTVAPAGIMMKPLAEKLKDTAASVEYKTIVSGHSFAGQRMKLTRIVGEWIEKTIE